MESKEQLSDPTLLPIHLQHLQLNPDHTTPNNDNPHKRKHSTLLPAIRHHPTTTHKQPAQPRQPRERPHTADGAARQQRQQHALPPPALAPLFSASHRVTAGGTIVVVAGGGGGDAALAAPVVEVVGREVEVTAGGGAALRERVILLEPIGVKAKVDSGLRRYTTQGGGDGEEARHGATMWEEEERKQRRRERTEQRRQERIKQLQQQQLDNQAAAAVRSQDEEKIQAEAGEQPTLSPDQWRAAKERMRRQGELDEALATLVLERTSETAIPTSIISANIQAGLYDAVMAATSLEQALSARGRQRARDAGDQVAPFGELSLDELRTHSRRRRRNRHGQRRKGRKGLVWSDDVQPSDLLPDEEPEWTYSVRVPGEQPHSSSSDEDESGQSEDGSESAESSGTDSTSDDGGEVVDAEHDDKLTAEQRVSVSLGRLAQGSRPATADIDSPLPSHTPSESPSSATSRPTSTAHPSRPTSASSASRTAHKQPRATRHKASASTSAAPDKTSTKPRRGRHATTVSFTADTATGKQKRAVQLSKSGRSKRQLEGELQRARQAQQEARDRPATHGLFDQRPVVLSTGDAIDRSAAYAHHAADVRLVVDMMAEAMTGSALASPITVTAVTERAAASLTTRERAKDEETAAPQTARGGKGGKLKGQVMVAEVDKRKEGKHAPSTTVLRGKDMMIVGSWVMALARRFLSEVMGEKQYADQPATSTTSEADTATAPVQDVVSVSKPVLTALERLSLDRRTLYNLGLTHERIDQIYSGLYTYSAGFYQLLYGFVQPNVPSTCSLSPALFLHRLWLAYLRLIELAHPPLYLHTLASVHRLTTDEAAATYADHVREAARSDANVRGKRDEVAALKDEYARTNEAHEDTLDGVSEARVTLMAMRETNWREERQLSEVSDEAIAELTAKAARAQHAQQQTHERNVRARERRAQVVKAIATARADIHLACMHHDDMTRLIGERGALSGQLEAELPAIQAAAEEAERCGGEAAALAAAIRLASYQLAAVNRQVQRVTEQQRAVIDRIRQLGLTSAFEPDEWPVVLAEVAAAHEDAQSYLTQHVPGQAAVLGGVDVAELERESRQLLERQGRLTDELKAKLGLDVYEREMRQRVAAAESIHADNARSLAALHATIAEYHVQLRAISDAYSLVYAENEAYLQSNGRLQGEVDALLARLAQLAPQQDARRASIAAARAATDDMREQCGALPAQVDALRAATAALVPRQTELSTVEAAKGEVYRALQDERDKLDREHTRSRRNEADLKAEMVELDAQLADMEERCQPLWRELDGKLGVLQREAEHRRQEWEAHGMALCEEERRIERHVDAVQAAEERVRPVEAELGEAQAAANEVRALLEAEQAVQDGVRREMRETREQMQAKTREKEEFLARHVRDNHELLDAKAAQLAHIAHLADTLQHNKSELRASYAVSDQMMLAHDKRLQQWNLQLEARREALRKRRAIDLQRREVQAVKRAEMLAARDAQRAECEAQQAVQRELEEELAMGEQELAQERAATADMERTEARLQRLHGNLSAAAPHLRHELDRVSGADLHFDVRQVERAVQDESGRQHELVQRLAQLEDEEWARRLGRTERWVQTDPSRHFTVLREELGGGGRQRYVLGVELGLMDGQWVAERQRAMDEDERRAEAAVRQRRSGLSLSPADTGRDARRSVHAHISPALAAHAAASPRIASMLPLAATMPTAHTGSRQRAESVTTRSHHSHTEGPGLGQGAGGRAGKARRGHGRTQTMLPGGWEQRQLNELSQPLSAGLPQRSSLSSTSSSMNAAHGFAVSAADVIAASPASASSSISGRSSVSAHSGAASDSPDSRHLTSRSVAREQQAREREQTWSTEYESRTVLSTLLDSSRRPAHTPSALSPQPVEQAGQRLRSPLSSHRPRSAAEAVDEAVAALTSRFAAQQQPLSPQSAASWLGDDRAATSRPSTAQSTSRPTSASQYSATATATIGSGAATGRLAAGSRHGRHGSAAKRSRSPVPGGAQLSAVSMIPESAMRPASPGPPGQAAGRAARSTRHRPSLSQQQQQQAALVGQAGAAEWEQFTGRLRAVADTDAEAGEARGADAAYEQFIASSTATTQHHRPLPAAATAEADGRTAAQPTAPQLGSPGLASKRGAVQVPALPLQQTGTLSDWLEHQARASADAFTDDPPPKPQHGRAQPPLQHRLLALSLPDQAQPVQRPEAVVAAVVEEPVSPPALMSGRRLALVADKSAEPQTVAAAMLAIQQPTAPVSADPSPALGALSLPAPVVSSPFAVEQLQTVRPEAPRAVIAAVEAFTRAKLVTREAPVPEYVPPVVMAEDERPGRVPRYVKRSIAKSFAQRRAARRE